MGPVGVLRTCTGGPDCRPVRFTLALPMCPPDRLLPLARLADERGWDALCLPDSVFFPEEVSADYPFTGDGERFWPADAPLVDPLVAHPRDGRGHRAARASSTNVAEDAAAPPAAGGQGASGRRPPCSPGRIGLGVGLSWMPEEFAWLGQDDADRGASGSTSRSTSSGRVLAGGWVEHHGDALRLRPAAHGAGAAGAGADPRRRPLRRRRCGGRPAWATAGSAPRSTRPRLRRARRAAARGARRGRAARATAVRGEGHAAVAGHGRRHGASWPTSALTDVITVPWYFCRRRSHGPGHQDVGVRSRPGSPTPVHRTRLPCARPEPA